MVAVSLVVPVSADIIYNSVQLTIPTNQSGISVSINGGVLNPFFGGVGVANNNALQPFRVGTSGLATIKSFGDGVFINGSSGSLATGAGGSSNHVGSTFTAGVESYLGFKLSGSSYGWARVVFTNNGTGAIFKDWAYDNTGAAIKTGWIKTDVITGTAQTVTLNPATGESFTLGSSLANASGSITNSLVKTGAGTTILGQANTYTGTTAISQGTLVVNQSIGASAVTVSGAGTILATDAAASFGSTLSIGNGAILAAGNAGAAGTATVTGATTFDNGSIFSWDINATGTSYDKLITSSLVDGNAAGGAVLRIVASDATFAETFWDSTQTWTDIFTTNGTTAIANWANIFTSVTVVNSSFGVITPVGGSFSVSGNTLTWSAIPEPTTALAGLLLAAGLLRRRRAA